MAKKKEKRKKKKEKRRKIVDQGGPWYLANQVSAANKSSSSPNKLDPSSLKFLYNFIIKAGIEIEHKILV
jgi:hypothetical protein